MIRASVISLGIRLVLTALFAVFAVIHLKHMLSLEWSDLGLHWRLVDIFYSTLALIVVAGFIRKARASVIALYIYSVSQLCVIALLAVLGKTWLPYTTVLQGADILAVVALLHVLALLGEGFVVKQYFDKIQRIGVAHKM